MFGNKKVTTLAEDFRALGLIRGESAQAQTPKLEESRSLSNKRAQLIEQKRNELRNKKLAEKKAAVARKRMVEAKRKELAKKKFVESKKAVAPKQESNGVSDSLRNLMTLEQKLKTSTSLGELVKAFENVQKVSRLAIRRFKKLGEADADSAREVKPNMNDNTDRPQAGKDIPASYKDVVDGKDNEGNVGVDKEDEQEGNLEKTKEVDTVTGKYAGKDQTVPAAEVDIVEGEEPDDQDDLDFLDKGKEEEDEVPAPSKDEFALSKEEEDEIMKEVDAEMGEMPPEAPKEEDDSDMDDLDDFNDGLDDASDFDDEDDFDISPEVGEGEDELKLGEGEIEEPGEAPEKEEEDEEEPKAEIPPTMAPAPAKAESKRMVKKAYVSELKDIYREAEDIMARIRKHAVTPADAEAVLKDIVLRLGGAVGDLADMSKYNGSDKQTPVAESKKKSK